jgi:hypothetical protein
MSLAHPDVTTPDHEHMFVDVGLRWNQSSDGDEDWWWGRDDTGRLVASVGLCWTGDGLAWRARWWGDRPPGALGVTRGRDATIVAEGLDDAEAAMAAVDAHIAARRQDPGRRPR